MKRMHAALLITALCLVAAAPVRALAGPVTAPVLRVFAGDRNEPFNFLRDGKLVGLGADVAQEMMRRTGYLAAIEPYPWARALAMAKITQNSLLFTTARSPEREDQFYWIGPIVAREVWLYRLASRNDIQPTTIEEAARYRAAMTISDASIGALRAQGFIDGSTLDVSSNDVDVARKLKAGRVDLVPLNPLTVDAFTRAVGMTRRDLTPMLLLTREGGYYLALNKDTSPGVKAALDAAFGEMGRDGTLQKIVTRWSGDQGALVAARKRLQK